MLYTILIGLGLASTSWAGSPAVTTFQTKIMAPNGQPLEATSVNFRFTTLNGAGTCVMYVEDFNGINMSGSQGIITLPLGSGSKQYPAGPVSLYEVYNNSTASFPCQSGGSVTPTSSENRQIVMQFNDGAGWQTLPQMAINSVFYSNFATRSEKLGDYVANDYLRPATLPTCGASEALRYDGTAFSCVSITGGAGGVSNVTGTSPISVATGSSTPVISITKASSSTSGYLSSADWTTFNSKANSVVGAGKLYLGNASGDATGVTLSGDATLATTGVMTLSNSGVTAGTYGSASAVPSFTVDSKGRVTSAATYAYQDATNVAKGVVQIGTNITLNSGVISVTSTDVTNALGYTPANATSTSGAFTNGGNAFSADASLGSTSNYGLNFITNNSPRMTILNTGYVGVGTTTPIAPLSVVGSISDFDGSGNERARLSNSGGYGYASFWNGGSVGAQISGSGNSYIMGNLGIGTATPATALEVSGGALFDSGVGVGISPTGTGQSGGTFKLGATTAAAPTTLDIGNSSTGTTAYGAYISRTGAAGTGVGLYVNSVNATTANYSALFMGGNVGIGTTSPGAKLEVVGDINITGNYKINGVAIGGGSGTVTNVSSANGDIVVATGSTTPVLTLNTGTSTNQIVKLTAAGKYPAVDGSLITNLNLANTTGILPIANGGTNSNTALNNNRIMVSSGGSIVESSALTNGQILIGYTGQAPVASTLSAGNGITVTNGTGTISLAADTGVGANKIPQIGGVAAAANSLLMVNGTGTALLGQTCSVNEVLKWNGSNWACSVSTSSQWTTASSDITFSGGNVGVGTSTTPTSVLDVNGAITQRGMAAPSVSATGQGRIYFDSSANKFKVSENGAAYTNLLTSVSSGGGFVNGGNAFSADATLGTNDNYKLFFKTNNTTQMAIDENGHLGVGTQFPYTNTQMVVFGDPSASNLSTTGGLLFGRENLSGKYGFLMGATTTTPAYAWVQGVNDNNSTAINYVINASGGNVGIGTTSPATILDIQQSSNSPYSTSGDVAGSQIDVRNTYGSGAQFSGIKFLNGSTASYNPVWIGNGSTVGSYGSLVFGGRNSGGYGEYMRIDPTGNVGIGTTSPGSKLEVVGDINITGNYKINGVAIGGGSGTVTNVSSANGDIVVATGSTTPVLTLNSGSSANQIVKMTSGGLYPAADGSLITNINLASGTGTLPIANGGTNSSTALNNNRIMVSSSGKIVESAALTNGQILIGYTGQAPVASTLSAGNGITVTNGTGTVSLAVDTGVGANKIPQIGGVAAAANSLLMVNGTSTALVGQTCTVNQILQWNGTTWACTALTSSQWTTTSSDIYYTAGKVGIGTTSPGAALDVQTSTGTGFQFSDNGSGSAVLTARGSGNLYLRPASDYVVIKSTGTNSTLQIEGNGGTAGIRFFNGTSNNIVTDTGNLTITPAANTIFSSGNVGIGTSTPTDALQVNGTIRNNASYNNASSTTIDWSKANTQYTAAGCTGTQYTFSNMRDGGVYTLAITGTFSANCTFGQTSPDTLSGTPGSGAFYFLPANATASGANAVFSFMRVGTKVYVTWNSGFAN